MSGLLLSTREAVARLTREEAQSVCRAALPGAGEKPGPFAAPLCPERERSRDRLPRRSARSGREAGTVCRAAQPGAGGKPQPICRAALPGAGGKPQPICRAALPGAGEKPGPFAAPFCPERERSRDRLPRRSARSGREAGTVCRAVLPGAGEKPGPFAAPLCPERERSRDRLPRRPARSGREAAAHLPRRSARSRRDTAAHLSASPRLAREEESHRPVWEREIAARSPRNGAGDGLNSQGRATGKAPGKRVRQER